MTATVALEDMSCVEVLSLFDELKRAARIGDRDAYQKALETARAIELEERIIEEIWTDGVSEPEAAPMTFKADGDLVEPCEMCGAGEGVACDLFCPAGII